MEPHSADFVVDIENSHCYQDKDLVFENVVRILKSDGLFIYADYIEAERTISLEQGLQKYFEIVK